MASFVAPFDPPTVELVEEVSIELPALPADNPLDPTPRPALPPGSARYAGAQLILIHAVTKVGPLLLHAPAAGTVRAVALNNPKLKGLTQLIELSPLPFAIAKVLRQLKGRAADVLSR